MNKHTKLGIIVAPFLAIGGYIAADYYQQHKMEKKIYHNLLVEGKCDIDQGSCLLKAYGLILKYTVQDGVTNIESNHPLATAQIGMADETGVDSPKDLVPDTERKNWKIKKTEYFSGKKSVILSATTKGQVFNGKFSSTK